MKKQFQDTIYNEHIEVQNIVYDLDIKITKIKKNDIYVDSVTDDNGREINVEFNGMNKKDLEIWIKFFQDIKARIK